MQFFSLKNYTLIGTTEVEVAKPNNSKIDKKEIEYLLKAVNIYLNQSINIVSSSYKAMIIYNEGDFFSAGANLGEALFLANIGLESELDKIKGMESKK